jgi:hypothetical protein
MAEKIEFELKVTSNDLQKALSDATNGSKKLGDTISTALGAFGGGLALKAFDALGSAISNTTGFIKESVDAAAEQEAALNKLAQSLRATGEFSRQAVEDLAQFASELQKASIYGDEVVIGQLAIAKSFGATNEQAKQLVQAAANLASTFGGTLEENVFKLGRTLGGVVSRELKTIVPEIKTLGEEALRSGDAIQVINERFGGAAASELNTYAGQTTALKNAFSDLQEEIGAFITGSSTLGSIVQVSTGFIQEITQSIVDYRTEQQRSNGTLVETEGTLNSLSEKYAKTRDEIEKFQSVINSDKEKTLLESLFSFDNAPLAKERVQALTAELQKLDSQIKKASEQVASQREAEKAGAVGGNQTDVEIKKIQELEAQKTLIASQAELERQNALAEAANVAIQNDQIRQEAELQRIIEFETQKKELEFQFAEQKALIIEDSAVRAAELAKIGKERELAFTQIANKNIIDNEKLKVQALQNQAFFVKKFEEQTQKERVANLQSTFSQIATLSQSGNKTLAAIGKSAAIANATIDGYAAVQKALASAPPPFNYALAAAVGAATTANVAKIAGVNFAEGGFVPPAGATRGPDNQLASIRTGELVLNADQQKNLLDMINSGTTGGGDIVINIDGREIIRVINNQIKSGARIAS